MQWEKMAYQIVFRPLVICCMDLAALPRPWANIPQYGPRTGLERGYYFLLAVKLKILCKAILNPSASYSCDFFVVTTSGCTSHLIGCEPTSQKI